MEKYLYNLGIISNLVLNSIILYDLYLSLKYPFYPRELRAKWYYLFSTTIIAIFSVSYLAYDPKDPTFNNWGT